MHDHLLDQRAHDLQRLRLRVWIAKGLVQRRDFAPVQLSKVGVQADRRWGWRGERGLDLPVLRLERVEALLEPGRAQAFRDRRDQAVELPLDLRLPLLRPPALRLRFAAARVHFGVEGGNELRDELRRHQVVL
ncbi:MAG: hypothetical protein O9972_63840 [Burkholderiales bacterium]|nr:hypothetical protein [Burkholderiales bacterium]